MSWCALIIAGLLEVLWSYLMKLSDGFRNIPLTLITLITMFVSFALLAYAMRSLPLGTAYIIWTGIGAVGAFIAGIILLGEQVSLLRIIAVLLILSGMILMKVTSTS